MLNNEVLGYGNVASPIAYLRGEADSGFAVWHESVNGTEAIISLLHWARTAGYKNFTPCEPLLLKAAGELLYATRKNVNGDLPFWRWTMRKLTHVMSLPPYEFVGGTDGLSSRQELLTAMTATLDASVDGEARAEAYFILYAILHFAECDSDWDEACEDELLLRKRLLKPALKNAHWSSAWEEGPETPDGLDEYSWDEVHDFAHQVAFNLGIYFGDTSYPAAQDRLAQFLSLIMRYQCARGFPSIAHRWAQRLVSASWCSDNTSDVLTPESSGADSELPESQFDGEVDLDTYIRDSIQNDELRALVVEYIAVASVLPAGFWRPGHLIFESSEETGQEAVADCLSVGLYAYDLLSNGHVYRVAVSDLVGCSVDETNMKAQEALSSAHGGVLLIDQIQTLVDGSVDAGASQALAEAIATAMVQADDLVIALSGARGSSVRLKETFKSLQSASLDVWTFPDAPHNDFVKAFLARARELQFEVSFDAIEFVQELAYDFRTTDAATTDSQALALADASIRQYAVATWGKGADRVLTREHIPR